MRTNRPSVAAGRPERATVHATRVDTVASRETAARQTPLRAGCRVGRTALLALVITVRDDAIDVRSRSGGAGAEGNQRGRKRTLAVSKAGADSGRRALELLFAFTEQRPVASVRQLAEDLQIPVPTAHRYVALLRDMGLIEERERGQYHLTMRVAALGRAARSATPLVHIAEPYMRELSEQIDETVLLVRMVHGLPVCIHRVESLRPFRLSFEPGQNMPPLRGASVRLLIGGLPESERERYVDRALAAGSLPPVSGRDAFLSDIARAVDQGWDVSREEIDEGVWAASAPIKEGGLTRAALSAPCPAFRLDESKRSAIIDQVRKTAEHISQALSG
ncbi:IclR family transcriptional regulator [Streptomyces sp. NPDC004546]|uniref:IclR family transcriptional regulator n=1 Tax=Streptomyces sp. NPDC004546 TaxID=3154282 RepID=UPI0033BEA5FA